MDTVVDAAHDRAQHSAASALATMGGPSATSSLPDLTGFSTDEVQMSMHLSDITTTWLFPLLNRSSFLLEPETGLGVSFRMPGHLHVLQSCLQQIDDNRNMTLLCEAHASLWAYL